MASYPPYVSKRMRGQRINDYAKQEVNTVGVTFQERGVSSCYDISNPTFYEIGISEVFV